MSWHATIAIGGMTCSSCANSIAEALTATDGVTRASVSLAIESVIVDFKGTHADARRIARVIEDMGYDASINDVTAVSSWADDDDDNDQRSAAESRPATRTVRIDVRSTNRALTPAQINDQFVSLPFSLPWASILSRRVTKYGVVLEISYTPAPPEITVRSIVAGIETILPDVTVSVSQPPTLEERAQRLNRRRRQHLLLRIIFTAVIAIPTFIIGIVYMSLVSMDNKTRMYLMRPWLLGISRSQMALWILATPVYFFTADAFHRPALRELYTLWKRGSRVPVHQRFYRFGSMNLLMSLGTSVAYIASLYQLIYTMTKTHTPPNDYNFYFDSVVFLTLFLLVGRFLEAYTKSKTSDAIGALRKLRPATAILLTKGAYGYTRVEEVAAGLLEVGDLIRVPQGASPPCDGIITEGVTEFDESSLTGESRPISKRVGDEVFPATTNKGAPVTVAVTKTVGETTLDKIVEVVREGQSKRAPIERAADTVTVYFVPIMILVALITWSTWFALGSTGRLPAGYNPNKDDWAWFALTFAISLFVVACPCGLALAAPTAIFVGVGLAAKHGILVRGGGAAFENARTVNTVVFDKTGTLTMGGEPTVTDSELLQLDDSSFESSEALLTMIRTVEEYSSHTLAKALVSFCSRDVDKSTTVHEVIEMSGKGLKANFTDSKSGSIIEVIIGNEDLMKEYGTAVPSRAFNSLRDWQSQAKSVVMVATRWRGQPGGEYRLRAAFGISDAIRPEAVAVIRALRSQGKEVYMLTGDNVLTARAVAARVGIDADTHVIAGVKPMDKAHHVRQLREAGDDGAKGSRRRVAMIGDGINDAPALAAADIGIAIGSGTDVAIAAADFVLVGGNLGGVVSLLGLSRKIFWRIGLNLGWAAVYNVTAVPVAAGCLYWVVANGEHVRLDPVWASLAMALSSVSVIASSLLLKAPWWLGGFRAEKL
ncbi:P-type Cu+ transporter [Microdochium nivale]|nr:P-type Cu+ transporter [Microdochium nivale]